MTSTSPALCCALLALAAACTPAPDASAKRDAPPGDEASSDGTSDDGGDGADGGEDPVDSADPEDSGDPPDGPWRSVLYPEDWAPGFGTPDLDIWDFSHAGYRGGADLPVIDATGAVSVLDHGADPTGTEDATAAIQAAIDAVAETGGVVRIPEGIYKVDGALRVSAHGTVLLGEGSGSSELWFTGSPDHGANLTFVGTPRATLSAALHSDAARWDTTVTVDAADWAPGDEVWIGIEITDDWRNEHSMELYWTFSAGQWRPFFRRTLTDVQTEGETQVLTLDVPLPYAIQVRDHARIERVDGYLHDVGIQGVGVSNATARDVAWAHSQVHAVAFDGVYDAFVQDLTSFAGPGGEDGMHLQSSGLLVRNSRQVTVADSRLGFSQHRGEGGNGYLFEVRVSNHVLVRDSTAEAGRHNFVQNWDFGTSELVFLRTHSIGGLAFTDEWDPSGVPACSETHHALAIALLVDSSTSDDCWKMVNRLVYSSGAGHTATESIFWNVGGTGGLSSLQYGRGGVIGTSPETPVTTEVLDIYDSYRTAPEDWSEGLGQGATLDPPSLYEDQLARRRAGE